MKSIIGFNIYPVFDLSTRGLSHRGRTTGDGASGDEATGMNHRDEPSPLVQIHLPDQSKLTFSSNNEKKFSALLSLPEVRSISFQKSDLNLIMCLSV